MEPRDLAILEHFRPAAGPATPLLGRFPQSSLYRRLRSLQRRGLLVQVEAGYALTDDGKRALDAAACPAAANTSPRPGARPNPLDFGEKVRRLSDVLSELGLDPDAAADQLRAVAALKREGLDLTDAAPLVKAMKALRLKPAEGVRLATDLFCTLRRWRSGPGDLFDLVRGVESLAGATKSSPGAALRWACEILGAISDELRKRGGPFDPVALVRTAIGFSFDSMKLAGLVRQEEARLAQLSEAIQRAHNRLAGVRGALTAKTRECESLDATARTTTAAAEDARRALAAHRAEAEKYAKVAALVPAVVLFLTGRLPVHGPFVHLLMEKWVEFAKNPSEPGAIVEVPSEAQDEVFAILRDLFDPAKLAEWEKAAAAAGIRWIRVTTENANA